MLPSRPVLPEKPRVDEPAADPSPATVQSEPEIIFEDPMAIVASDKALPAVRGALERIDCKSGNEDLHARVALEARGGQITSLAYYSRWRFRTCSISLDQRDAKIRWRRTEDGATRVQTPSGSFLLRADTDNYTIEFRNVLRNKFCGMYGRLNGVMTVRRNADPPQCSVAGVLDL
jgi:hypothetical protein